MTKTKLQQARKQLSNRRRDLRKANAAYSRLLKRRAKLVAAIEALPLTEAIEQCDDWQRWVRIAEEAIAELKR